MLKLNKSFSIFIMKGKHRFLLLFISFCSSSVAFIHIDWPFILSQLLIFFRLIILSNPYILLLIRVFLKSFNSLHVINNSSVLSVMDDGNNIPHGVNLYITFLCFLSALIILSSSSSIWTGISPPTISKFYWEHTMIVSIGSCIGSFLFLPILVRDRLWFFIFKSS